MLYYIFSTFENVSFLTWKFFGLLTLPMLEGGVKEPLRDSPPLHDSSASSNSIDFLIAAWCISSFMNALNGKEYKNPLPPFLLKCSDRVFKCVAKKLLSKNLLIFCCCCCGVIGRPIGVEGGALGDEAVPKLDLN